MLCNDQDSDSPLAATAPRRAAALAWLPQCLAALLLWAQAAAAVELSANVDRTTITLEDSITLTIRISEQSNSGRPDFSQLAENFDLLSAPSERSQYQVINGRVSSFTQWQIQLAPKRVGKLLIPSFAHQGRFSEAIEITVLDPVAGRRGDLPEIYLEAETGKAAVYVQEQLLLTVRLFTSVTLQSVKSEDIQIADARIEEIAEHQYQRTMAGKTYAVVESVYAVFPQTSGQLTVPAITWAVTTAGNRSSFFGPSGGAIKRLRSQPIEVRVKPKPGSYPDRPWLPAQQLSLLQSWSRPPDTFTVGEPITRTLELSAQGLTAAQLPPMPFTGVDGIKVYPEQPQTEDFKSNDGIRGVRTESLAIVPSRPGNITLPAVVLTWWDTGENRQRQTTLPEQVIEVLPSAELGSIAPMTPAPVAGAAPAAASGPPALRAWQLATAVCALAALLFAGLWLRGTPPARQTPSPPDRGGAADSEQRAFRQLQRACAGGDPAAIRRALLAWAQVHWDDPGLTRVAALSARLDSDDARAFCQTLESALYAGRDTAVVDCRSASRAFIDHLAKLRSSPSPQPQRRNALPELYGSGRT